MRRNSYPREPEVANVFSTLMNWERSIGRHWLTHFRMVASSHQRRGEIGALQWSWIKEDTITLPGSITKNKRTHTFPLGSLAKSIVEAIPETGPYLFPAARSHIRGKHTTHFNGWAKAKPLFNRGLEIEPFTLHDLRRTFSSHLAALGVPLHVTEKLLNHSSGSLSGVAAIYNRHTYLPEMWLAIDN